MQNSTLLVLFDAENMAIQTVYRAVEAIVIKEFSEEIWKSAKLVTAYKEQTERHSNQGYNDLIQTYYVGYGKDKADNKLVEIAQKNTQLDMVVVSSDRALISRVQEIAKGSVLVCNARRIYDYILDELHETKVVEKELKEKKELYFKEYLNANRALKNIHKKMAKKRKLLKEIHRRNPYVENMKEYIFDPFQNTILDGFSSKIEPTYVKTHPKLREVSLEVIKTLLNTPKVKEQLEGVGLDVSVIKMAIEYAVIDFSKSYFGFNKFIDFVRFFLKDSQLKLVFKEPSLYKIVLKEYNMDGFVDVEPFKEEELVETVESIKELYLEKKSPSSLDMELLENLKKRL